MDGSRSSKREMIFFSIRSYLKVPPGVWYMKAGFPFSSFMNLDLRYLLVDLMLLLFGYWSFIP